jgi:hypothetical protein
MSPSLEDRAAIKGLNSANVDLRVHHDRCVSDCGLTPGAPENGHAAGTRSAGDVRLSPPAGEGADPAINRCMQVPLRSCSDRGTWACGVRRVVFGAPRCCSLRSELRSRGGRLPPRPISRKPLDAQRTQPSCLSIDVRRDPGRPTLGICRLGLVRCTPRWLVALGLV